jgi:hypothetical protein
VPRLSLGLSANVKNWFFDRELVRRSLSGATREALSKAGALVRTIARRSMKYVTSLRQQARQIDAGQRKRMAPVPSSPPGLGVSSTSWP